jgi:serine phosphatase RsbU (regulator of sigma subunit)
MRRVNHVLMQDEIMEDTFASLLLMRWEPAQHRITYCNAGHCRPILLTPKGPEIVGYSDIILGLDSESDFRDTRIEVPPDSALIASTDGLTEQRMSSGDQLGEKRLMSMAAGSLNSHNPIPELLRTILLDSEENAFTDDILVFWLRRFTGR